MHRVEPFWLSNKVPCTDSGQSTALHEACSSAYFSKVEREEVLDRLPVDVLASSRGPHGRTPVLHAAACGRDGWVQSLLDRLPQEALAVIDDCNCSLLHLMTFLGTELQGRILHCFPDVQRLCVQRATVPKLRYRVTGNAIALQLLNGNVGVAEMLLAQAKWEDLLADDFLVFGDLHHCSLLHVASFAADSRLCLAIISRVLATDRSALTAVDAEGRTPFHVLVAQQSSVSTQHCLVVKRNWKEDHTTRLLAIGQGFLDALTDDELLVTDTKGTTVLEDLLASVKADHWRKNDSRIYYLCKQLIQSFLGAGDYYLVEDRYAHCQACDEPT